MANEEEQEVLRRLAERIAADPCTITKIGSDGVAVQSQVKHNDVWKWIGPPGAQVMTDWVVCTTCGRERKNNQTNPNLG